MANEHRTGRVNSGDVSLFYRVFGKPGAMPILILHGSNYYDSVDWIEVAGALATDREVVTPDRRGWGDSTWSPSKDNSLDALLDDMLAVMRRDEVGEGDRHGPFRRRADHHFVRGQFPADDREADPGDSQMNREESARTGKSIGNPPYVFESVEAAMAKHKFYNPPRFSLGPQARRAGIGESRQGPHAQARSRRRQPPADRGGRGAAAPAGARDVGRARDGEGADDRHSRQPFVALSGGDGRAAHEELSAHPAGRGRFRARRRRPGARGVDRACTEFIAGLEPRGAAASSRFRGRRRGVEVHKNLAVADLGLEGLERDEAGRLHRLAARHVERAEVEIASITSSSSVPSARSAMPWVQRASVA